eukprot:552378-Pelagomonas_calceolata.AAC.1
MSYQEAWAEPLSACVPGKELSVDWKLQLLPAFSFTRDASHPRYPLLHSCSQMCLCHPPPQEDLDSTPCAAVPSPDPGCDVATSVHVDELAAAMWTGEGTSGLTLRTYCLGQSPCLADASLPRPCTRICPSS